MFKENPRWLRKVAAPLVLLLSTVVTACNKDNGNSSLITPEGIPEPPENNGQLTLTAAELATATQLPPDIVLFNETEETPAPSPIPTPKPKSGTKPRIPKN